jgi:2,4-dienoyl-CoA reductase-like NADH-dependent reductase (Old Yellow Enzyme family)
VIHANPPTANVPLNNRVASGSNTVFIVTRGGAVGYGTKALYAQQAGAAAVVIVSSLYQPPHPPGHIFMGNHDAASVTIPVYMISADDGL